MTSNITWKNWLVSPTIHLKTSFFRGSILVVTNKRTNPHDCHCHEPKSTCGNRSRWCQRSPQSLKPLKAKPVMIRPTASFFITYLALPLQRWKFMVYIKNIYMISLYLKSCDKIEMLDIFCLQWRTINAPVATFCQPIFQVQSIGFPVSPLSWTGEPMQKMRIFNTRKIYQVHSPPKTKVEGPWKRRSKLARYPMNWISSCRFHIGFRECTWVHKLEEEAMTPCPKHIRLN